MPLHPVEHLRGNSSVRGLQDNLRFGTGVDRLTALRFRAFTRPPREGEAPLPAGAGIIHLGRVNKLFMLGDDYLPRPSVFAWTGHATIRPEGPPLELAIRTP